MHIRLILLRFIRYARVILIHGNHEGLIYVYLIILIHD